MRLIYIDKTNGNKVETTFDEIAIAFGYMRELMTSIKVALTTKGFFDSKTYQLRKVEVVNQLKEAA